ncbi:MAG TPA: hypothetical protein V6C57_25965 [Coleofasciculaceae cyanobacterium]
MNQQRLQSYISLIQKLLACPSGEEWTLLRQNEALVTPELVQVMEQVATQLANQGNLKAAKFLHHLAVQIHPLFVGQPVPPSAEEDHSQAYLELIQALLNCPKGSEGELLAANQALIGPGLVHTMQQVAAQVAANGDQETATHLQDWATELNRLWLQQHNFPSFLKQDSEPQDLDYTPGATPFIPPQDKFLRPSPAAPSEELVPDEDDQDIWAELSGELPKSVQTQPHPLPTPEPPSAQLTAAELPDLAPAEQINRHLETIAKALTRLSETLPAQPPNDPLWYMEVLERAQSGNWVLTSAELHKLIGVHPTCPKGSESFQRGCWVFVKAGKLGAQTAWQVRKANPASMQGDRPSDQPSNTPPMESPEVD